MVEPTPQQKDRSLLNRLIVIDIMIPTLVLFDWWGGWLFYVFVATVVLIAGWELWRIYHNGKYSPSLVLILLTIFACLTARQLWGFEHIDIILSVTLLTSIAIFIVEQQKGKQTSAVDFAITVGSGLYLGWLSSYALSLRALPDGLLWTFLIFPAVALADAGGYIFGIPFGRHKIAINVSPKKSWEGYLGGIFMAALITWGLAALFHIVAPGILPVHGLIIGLVIAIFTPLGDFGESMLKRQFNVKDSSHILPGHGGFLDRIDSALWAAVIGYYLILFLK